MLHGKIISHLDFSHPSAKVQSLIDHPIFLGDCEDEGCNVFRFSTIKPRGLRKSCLALVAYGDGSGGVKDVHVFLGTWVTVAPKIFC
jgi:hypothetical protein